MKIKTGFTIVELLIVIVVISILAAVTATAYGNMQNRASNSSIVADGASWSKQFKVYYATYGTLPGVPGNYYCLGTGFPIGTGGVPRCRDYTSTNSVLESDNTALMSELSKVGTLPKSTKVPINGSVGAFVWFYDSKTADVIMLLKGSSYSDCPATWAGWWTDGTERLFCVQQLRF